MFLHRKHHRRPGLVGGRAPFGRVAFDHPRQIADPQWALGPLHHGPLDHGGGKVFETAGSRTSPHQVLLARVDMESGRGRGIGFGQRIHHPAQRHPAGGEGRSFDFDLDLAGFAANRHHLRHPGHRQEGPPHADFRHAAQNTFVGAARLRGQGQEGDFPHDRGYRPELRPIDIGGQGRGLDAFADDLPRPVDVFSPGEFDPHHGNAGGGHGTDTAYTRRAVDRRFERQRHQDLDFFRRPAGSFGEQSYGGGGKIRENIDRQAGDKKGADQKEDGKSGGHRSRCLQGEANPLLQHGLFPPF